MRHFEIKTQFALPFQIFVLTLQTQKNTQKWPFSDSLLKNTTMRERIKQIQTMTKMSQQDFAKAIGVSPGSLSSVYSQRTQPTNNYVEGIHKAFPEININWLMFGEGEIYNHQPEQHPASPTSDDTPAAVQPGRADANLFDQPEEQIGGDVLPFAVPRVTPIQRPQPSPVREQNYGSQTPQYTPVSTAKDFDFKTRKVKEIRVFFDDGTYESFLPSK